MTGFTKFVLVAAVGGLTLNHTGAFDALAEVRERQYAEGQRIGCQLRLAAAINRDDLDRAVTLAEDCNRFE